MRVLSLSFVLLSCLSIGSLPAPADDSVTEEQRIEAMAQSVTIRRDEWGVPHIDGPTDASVAFGMAYVQCEDYFWQVEDSYIQSIGRYSEIVGPGCNLESAECRTHHTSLTRQH